MMSRSKRNRNVSISRPFDMIDNFVDSTFKNLPFSRDDFPTGPFKVDVKETLNEYLVDAELPGITKDEIDVRVNDEGQLTIAVTREENIDEQDEDHQYIHRERRYDSMKRSLLLADARPDDVRAKLEDGLLRVIVGKDQQAKDNSRKIEIE